ALRGRRFPPATPRPASSSPAGLSFPDSTRGVGESFQPFNAAIHCSGRPRVGGLRHTNGSAYLCPYLLQRCRTFVRLRVSRNPEVVGLGGRPGVALLGHADSGCIAPSLNG